MLAEIRVPNTLEERLHKIRNSAVSTPVFVAVEVSAYRSAGPPSADQLLLFRPYALDRSSENLPESFWCCLRLICIARR